MRISILFVAVGVALVAGCGVEPTYTRARVSDAVTGKPLGKVKVNVILEDPNRPAQLIADAETNDHGVLRSASTDTSAPSTATSTRSPAKDTALKSSRWRK